jgi:hypothetical protein
MRTLFGDALRGHAADPHAPAALASGAGEVSYAELVERVERLASFLVREGCAASIPVGISVVDDVDGLVATLALLDLGVPQVTLSTAVPCRCACRWRDASRSVAWSSTIRVMRCRAWQRPCSVPDRERDSHDMGSGRTHGIRTRPPCTRRARGPPASPSSFRSRSA